METLSLSVHKFSLAKWKLRNVIETDMLQEAFETLGPVKSEAYIRSVPLQRVGHPEEIAEVVRFLVSEKVSYITGQIFFVNGGGPGAV